MTTRYFDQFPTITYSNTQAIDITKRTAVLNSVASNPYVVLPYELDVFERPDQFSNRYYEDSYKAWILYLSNNITDPYYEWYLQDNEFYDFLTSKYGSSTLTQQKIKFYRNNWVDVDNISASEYNALPFSLKKYWAPNPVYAGQNQSISYTRIQQDWTISTNKIATYTVPYVYQYVYQMAQPANSYILNESCVIEFDPYNVGLGKIINIVGSNVYVIGANGTFVPSGTAFIRNSSFIYGIFSNTTIPFTSVTANPIFATDELCNIVFDNNDSGTGQVVDIVGNIVYMQHLSGTFVPSNTVSITANSYIYGVENGGNSIFTSATQVANNLAPEEEVYWQAITYFEYETEKNNYNQSIKVLDNRLTKTIVNNLTTLMSQ